MIRKNCAITDCDTRACYDRILPHVLYLCYSKMGLTPNEYVWIAKALVNMRYHIITGHGPSHDVSKYDDKHPLFGIGQRATDASAGWLMISTFLSQVYDRLAQGCHISSPDKKQALHWSHIIFVDDANLIHATTEHDPTVEKLRCLVQKEVTMWNDSLHTPGTTSMEINPTSIS